METIDVPRLKEIARFLKDGEDYTITFEEGLLSTTLTQGKNWLHVGMRWTHTSYRHGINLSHEMQANNNFEYWVFKLAKHMLENMNTPKEEG